MLDLFAISDDAAAMDPLPASVGRLAALTTSDAPDLDTIIEVVRYDQALTVALLRSANSSWSAPKARIATARDAIVRLGAGSVLALATGMQLRTRLSSPLAEYGLGEGDLWRHSVAALLAAETINPLTPVSLPTETATAALVHDLGKLLMVRYLESHTVRAMELAHETGVTRAHAEAEILGVDHAELGGLLAHDWGLPEVLVAGISHHHTPQESDDPLVHAVHVADAIANAIGIGTHDNDDPEGLDAARRALDLSPSAFDDACAVVTDRFAEVSSRFA